MPRLPDYTDVGGRVAPQPSRSVASNPRAGAVAEALAGFGGQIVGAGKDMLEQQDRLETATAKARILKSAYDIRRDLQENDPDFESWGAKFNERMKPIREQAVSSIQSRSAKALFDVDAGADIDASAAQLGEIVSLRRKDAGVAAGMDALNGLQDVATGATDDAERDNAFRSVAEIYDGFVAKGWMTAVEASEGKRQWAKGYGQAQIDALITQDRPEEARVFLDKHRAMFDFATESALDTRITDAQNNRDVLNIAKEAVAEAESGVASGAATSANIPASTFQSPVANGGTITSRYGVGRGGGKVHGGLDIAAPKGTPIRPIAGGVVEVVRHNDGDSGNWVKVRHPDGTTSTYSHMDSQSVKVGDVVAAGSSLGTVGSTGHSTGPHVHLVVRDAKGNKVDPEKVIGSKSSGGDVTGSPTAGEFDLEAVYSIVSRKADALGWSPEKKEKALAQVDREVGRRETLKRRDEDDADDEVKGIIAGLGDNFTSMSQIPAELQKRMSKDMTIYAGNQIKSNTAPRAPAANGAATIYLDGLKFSSPAAFASLDLGPYMGVMTNAEFAYYAKQQKEVAEALKGWTPYQSIDQAVTRGENWGGVKLNPVQKNNVRKTMQGEAERFVRQNGGKAPSENDYWEMYQRATRSVMVGTTTSYGIFGSKKGDPIEKKLYDLTWDKVNPKDREKIINTFQKTFHRDPTPDEGMEWYFRQFAPGVR